MDRKFERWMDRLEAIMRDAEFESSADEELMKNYFREGFSPQEFFDEILVADQGDVDFDPRYEM